MNKNTYKSFPSISGGVLIILSIVMFVFPTLLSGAVLTLLGLALVIYGLAKITGYMSIRKLGNGVTMEFITGIIAAAVGSILIFSQSARTFLFGMACALWVLSTGLERLSTYSAAKRSGISPGNLNLIIGVLGILAGIALFLNPILSVVSTNFMIAAAFMVLGISSLIPTLSR